VHEVRLEAGDALVLYTDGVTEAEGAGGEPYGTARLVRSIEAAGRSGASARNLAEAILADALRHAPAPADDVSVLVVKRTI
jgi:serine phosphatase RsbU (regulator of sigma subunit)